MKHAFSLVELSIVLVILGLLTGGILAGQSLIRAAELRSVTTDLARYRTAIFSFRDRYFGLPGDITNATKFWGADTSTGCGTPVAGDRVAKQATCDGDGNGSYTGSIEIFRAWQQLANAGLIEGSYTGVRGTGSSTDSDPKINVPATRIGNGGVSLLVGPGNPWNFFHAQGNMMEVGTCGIYDCNAALLASQEAWNLDTKLDDGKPGLGQINAMNTVAQPNCTDGADNTASVAQSAVYRLDTGGVACALVYYFE